MRVSEAMTRDVRVANPGQSIREVAKMMDEIDAGALPVGENDRLVGMITDRERGHRDRERCLLRCSGLGGRDQDRAPCRDQDPAPDIWKQHPAHRAVVRKRHLARARRAKRGVLEQREGIEIDQQLADERQAGAGLAAEQGFDFVAHAHA